MYLSKLDIVGFKSFAQKTNFTFSEGLSALVGPNGCGKTNIVDAIRWVLGEKKASVLRSDVMENVIFNGTKTRKPLGMAEVVLTIENNRNLLPIEYNQVTIARRLYRSGDSEYLLNKTKCRLRDILDLFLDTGMGSDSYSVIELKMVEAILSGRVDERRAMFEEAAGIKKYKIRRKETARKLDSVRLDLERVQDIVEEVRKNVNSLSRQAAKTRRYNKLTEELKDVEIKLFMHEFDNIRNIKNTLSDDLNELNKNKIKFEFEITSEERSIGQLKEKLHTVSKDYHSSSETEKSLNNQLAYSKEKLAAKKEKLSSYDTTKSLLLTQIEETELKIKDTEFLIQKNESELEALKSQISEAEKELELKIAARDEAAAYVTQLRENTGSANEEVLELQNRLNSIKSVVDRNNSKKQSVENKIQRIHEEKNSLEEQKEELARDLDSMKGRLAELETDLSTAETELATEEERKTSLQTALDNLRDELSDKKNIISSKKASVEFLEGLVDTNESSKFLLKKENWDTELEKLLLGELVGADEEHRIAVDAALGEYAHSFVVDTKQSAFDAINALKEKVKGRASFIIKENIPEINAPKEINFEGCYGYISEIVRTDDDIRHALRGMLGNTVLVSDGKTALEIIAAGLTERAVTLTGEVVENNGYLKGGSISKKEGQSIGKKERLNKLAKEIAAIQNEIHDIETESDEIRDEINSIDINELKGKVKHAENEINSINHKINQTELKETAIEDKLSLSDINIETFQSEITEIDNENSKFVLELEELESEISTSKESYQSTLNALAKAEEELNAKDLDAKNKEIDKINISAEIRNKDNLISGLKKELESSEIKIKAKKDELDSGEEDKEQLQIETNQLIEEIAVLDKNKDETTNRTEQLEMEKDSLQEQYEQYSDMLSVKRRDMDKIKEKIHEKDVRLSELNVKLENIANKVTEDHQIDLNEVEFTPEPDFSVENAKNEVSSIKDSLSKLGNVNFMALEEFEQQSSRLEFYDKQMEDLTESEKTLQETMEEINNAAEQNFRETFIKIRENFKHLFQTLFGEEGEADIKLSTEDNPLESDIEIIAKPPYKRPHSIEMLSGGEKTLTAIALLFGIYLVKPSPFCILDEVDAPLDDNNIGKFINLIKKFSNETQFLIVTHNKGTMEAADTLYGVTMQEDGVSKVVSVKVDENEKNNSAA